MKSESLAERLRRIEVLLLDVDGVLTDGSIVYSGDEPETKSFSVRDGFALNLWKRQGGRTFVVTGRNSRAVERRCKELGVEVLVQSADSKTEVFRRLLDEHRLAPDVVAAIGDDWPDLPLLLASGVGITVPEATEEIRQQADDVTKANGGRGAVAEVVEKILRAKGTWGQATEEYRRPA
jgi:3-deoxy-D-manno-octulosonate 8-phosphate phosphatase (KDO 8-P phosphatase)